MSRIGENFMQNFSRAGTFPPPHKKHTKRKVLSMLETLKKTIFAGVGATVMSADAVKNALTELVKKGKISAEDAKAAFEKAAERGEKDVTELYEKATARGKEALDGISCAKRVAALEKRVAALEEKLGVVPAEESVPADATETPAEA